MAIRRRLRRERTGTAPRAHRLGRTLGAGCACGRSQQQDAGECSNEARATQAASVLEHGRLGMGRTPVRSATGVDDRTRSTTSERTRPRSADTESSSGYTAAACLLGDARSLGYMAVSMKAGPCGTRCERDPSAIGVLPRPRGPHPQSSRPTRSQVLGTRAAFSGSEAELCQGRGIRQRRRARGPRRIFMNL